MPTLLLALAELCEKLESTSKRKAMVSWVASFILQLGNDEVEPAMTMLMGRALPKWDQRVLEVSWATLSTIIRRITGTKNEDFSRAYSKSGDVGAATRIVFEEGKLKRQATLFKKQLTILEVRHTFETIAETTGAGSREKKERLLETLLGASSPIEAKYLIKVLTGEMRTGFHEGLMELTVVEAFNVPPDVVQNASMLTGDVAEVAALAKAQGKEGLRKLKFEIFRPIKPMLAQTANSLNEILEEHNGQTALEYKLDGARIQIHKSGSNVKVYSRRLTDVTESLPEIVELMRDKIDIEEAILEGEVIAVDRDCAPLAFQHLMRRFRRVRKIEKTAEEVPVQLHLFDVLYADGHSLVNETYVKRREKLTTLADNVPLVKQILAKEISVAEKFLEDAIEAGHEGVMAKRLDSLYTPGIRGKRWFKFKRILEPLDLVIVAAEYGYGRRHGWLSDYYLAARDEKSGELLMVGKTFKGLTDSEIKEMTQKLKELTVKIEGHRIAVLPKIVVEVAYNEIQESPTYSCGMALRFARITRIRSDKSVDDVDTIQKVQEIFEAQFLRKSRLHGN